MDRPSQIQAIPILYLLSTEAHQVVMYSNKQLLLHLAHQTIPQLHVFSIFAASHQLTHSAQLGHLALLLWRADHLPLRARRLLPALPSRAAAACRPARGLRAPPFSQAFARLHLPPHLSGCQIEHGEGKGTDGKSGGDAACVSIQGGAAS